MSEETEASFICYDTEYKTYILKIRQFTWRLPESMFFDCVRDITDKTNNSVQMPVQMPVKDSDIEGLPIGWLWYVFLMGISVIFKDAIGLWIFITIVFFGWRAKKKKERGTYIKW